MKPLHLTGWIFFPLDCVEVRDWVKLCSCNAESLEVKLILKVVDSSTVSTFINKHVFLIFIQLAHTANYIIHS